MAQFQFDARQFQPDAGISDPVPKGWYNVMAEKSEMKPTKGGDGFYLEFTHTIVDGKYQGRKLYDRYNIRNNNPQAQDIAYRQLSALSHAVGVLGWQDSANLHNIPFKVKVKVRAGDGQYEASNDVISRKNINEKVDEEAGDNVPSGAPMGAQPPMQMPPAQQQQAPQGWGAPQPAQQQQAPQQQPWAQQPAPQQQPAMQQPAPVQYAPQQQPAQPPMQQPAMQQPAAQPWAQQPQQPWAAAPAQQPAQPPMPPQQQQPAPAQQYPQQQAVPPWAQQR